MLTWLTVQLVLIFPGKERSLHAYTLGLWESKFRSTMIGPFTGYFTWAPGGATYKALLVLLTGIRLVRVIVHSTAHGGQSSCRVSLPIHLQGITHAAYHLRYRGGGRIFDNGGGANTEGGGSRGYNIGEGYSVILQTTGQSQSGGSTAMSRSLLEALWKSGDIPRTRWRSTIDGYIIKPCCDGPIVNR